VTISAPVPYPANAPATDKEQNIKKSVGHLGLTALLAVFLSTASFAQSWKFAMTCDSRGYEDGVNKTILGELAGQLVSQNVDFVLFPGDLITGPLDCGITVYVGRGNHEVRDGWYTQFDPNDNFALRWLNVFGSNSDPNLKVPGNGPPGEEYMTYSVTHKNAFIVMLDQYAGLDHRLDHKVNQTWLDARLAVNTRPHLFVTSHEPAFKGKNRMGLDMYPDKRDAFWAAIAENAGRTYFCGHDHFYNHARIDDADGDPNNDVHQYIVGTAGPLYTWDEKYPGDNSHYTPESIYHARRHGYLLVEVNDLDVGLTWYERHTTALDVNGIYEPNDTWSYTATPKPILLRPNGGETIAAGSTCPITWKTLEGADIGAVKLDFSPDAGQTWHPIVASLNNGLYNWSTPPADSNDCLIRISDFTDPNLADASDRPFAIYPRRPQRRLLCGLPRLRDAGR